MRPGLAPLVLAMLLAAATGGCVRADLPLDLELMGLEKQPQYTGGDVGQLTFRCDEICHVATVKVANGHATRTFAIGHGVWRAVWPDGNQYGPWEVAGNASVAPGESLTVRVTYNAPAADGVDLRVFDADGPGEWIGRVPVA